MKKTFENWMNYWQMKKMKKTIKFNWIKFMILKTNKIVIKNLIK